MKYYEPDKYEIAEMKKIMIEYKKSDNENKCCSNCSDYNSSNLQCKILENVVNKNCFCKFWKEIKNEPII